jgi:hypothetical protein
MPVLLADVAVYIMVAAPWQRVEVDPNTKTGVPTLGVLVAECVDVFGPLQPAAVAVIVDTPDHAAA